MQRVLGAVANAVRSLAPRATATAAPSAVHQEKVRKAMEALAPKGKMLPSENKALAMELTKEGGKGSQTPPEMYLAANALHQVCSWF